MTSAISKYDDYREFIRDSLESLKSSNKKYSFEYCAKKIGTSKGYLKLLTQRKRHSSRDRILKIAAFLKLSDFENQYLVFLFLEQTSREPKIKLYFKQVLWNLRDRADSITPEYQVHNFLTRTILNSEARSASRLPYKSWLHTAIICLARFEDFRPDPGWIGAKLRDPSIAAETLQRVLDEILTAGLLVETESGWSPSEVFYREPHFADPDEYRDYQGFINRVSLAMEDVNRHRSFCFQGRGFAMNLANERAALNLYQELLAKLLELERQSDKPSSVLIMCNNIFNVVPDPKYSA